MIEGGLLIHTPNNNRADSHGMQAHRYGAMMDMIQTGKLAPEKLIGKEISLEQSIYALMNMDRFDVAGVTVVTEF